MATADSFEPLTKARFPSVPTSMRHLCVTAISEQGGKETQHGNDERQCPPGVTTGDDI
jgi:hypothetical protein